MSAPETTRTSNRQWFAVFAVTFGSFSIVTTEILPIGLLTPIGAGFGLSPGRTGWQMTMPGLVAAVAAPLITVLTARLDRRVLVDRRRTRGAAGAGAVDGAGDGSDLFCGPTRLSARCAGWDIPGRTQRLADAVRCPFLRDVTGVAPDRISGLLLVYGAAGFVGNLVAGTTAARHLRATFGLSAGLLAAATLLLPAAGRSTGGAVVLLVVWGLAYGAVPVCSMTWFASTAPEYREGATVVFTASFQATLSAGAFLGGLVVDSSSVSTAMICGGLVAALVAVLLVTQNTGGGWDVASRV